MATMAAPASSSRGMRMKKMAKIMPRNSTMVSVRQTGRFSLAFQRLLHLVSARSHRRSSPAIIRFSTKAMHTPISSGASRDSRPDSTFPMAEMLYRPQNSSTAKAISSIMRCVVFLFRSMATRPFQQILPLSYHVFSPPSIKNLYTFCPLVSFCRGWYNPYHYKQEVRA